jgi:uncharacterized protein
MSAHTPTTVPSQVAPATGSAKYNRAAVLARLAEFRRVRGQEFRLDSLGLFGSFARDEAGPQSDVDVVFRTARPNLLVTVQLKQALEQAMGRPVDVVRLRDAMNPRLKSRIERDAVYV